MTQGCVLEVDGYMITELRATNPVNGMSLTNNRPFTWKVDNAIPPPGYIDLKNLLPIPEETYICPFISNHRIKGRRFKRHILRCSRSCSQGNFGASGQLAISKWTFCFKNGMHLVHQSYLQYHTC